MKISRPPLPLILIIILLTSYNGYAQMMDLSRAEILHLESQDALVSKSVAVLAEEIAKRSNIHLPIRHQWTGSDVPLIIVGLESDAHDLPQGYKSMIAELPAVDAEGYKLVVDKQKNVVIVTGADPRGVLYGVGKLLRSLEIRKDKLSISGELSISSSPAFPIRGHQLGYRPKTNSYDAWTVAQFDTYIRDLAIFGANSIEIMPPRTDDDFTNDHMKLSAHEMMVEQSRICDSYGMDVWMWYPNLGSDYTHPDSV